MRQGKLVDTPFAGECSDFVEMLDDPDNPELLRFSGRRSDAQTRCRSHQATKSDRKVAGKSFQSELGVSTLSGSHLGRSRDLDSVPLLLYALTDPDKTIVLEADAALRFISRKFRALVYPQNLRKLICSRQKSMERMVPSDSPQCAVIRLSLANNSR